MAGDEELVLLEGPASRPQMPVTAWLAAMGGLTLLAVAAGGLVGINLVGTIKEGLGAPAKPEQGEPTPHYESGMQLRQLAPIITNLAQPSDAWIRLQAAIVFDAKSAAKPDVDAAEITADILAFLRTLSIDQIAGASGLAHLREDLNERAAIRSEGRVREVIIQTLVVQ